MSQTKSYDYTAIRDFFIRDSSRLLSELSSRSLGTASSDAERCVRLSGANIYLEEWSRMRTLSTNLEVWIKEHKKPIKNLQKCFIELMQQLSPEWTVEVKHDDEAIVYCANQRLIQYLAFAEDLIRKHFHSVDRISSSIEYNPETNDKWVSIDVEVTGDMNQVIEWEGSFVKEWVASVPYPERNKIRLSCDII